MGIIDGELTSVALCWKMERADGAGVALTSHDRPFVRDGVRFEPGPGNMPASITRKLGLEANAGEVAGAISAEALDAEDLAVGRWDGATVQLSAVDWSDEASEPVVLLGGEIGGVSVADDSFTADFVGAAARLDEPVCPTTSPECRAQFGDKSCRVDLGGRTIRAVVIGAVGGELTIDRTLDERFVLGRASYLGGANCGLTSVVLEVDGATVRLRDAPRADVEPGCSIELREGCDKRFATCVERFDNAVNFRGEPHLPGNDLLTRYPGA